MLLELCKSAVHIMFSDMCPLERGRAREKVGRGQRKWENGITGTWHWGEREQWTSCGPGILHHSEQGMRDTWYPIFSCPSPFFRLSPFSPGQAWLCWLSVFNVSFCEIGIAQNREQETHENKTQDRHGSERSVSGLQPYNETCCSSRKYGDLFLLPGVLRS